MEEQRNPKNMPSNDGSFQKKVWITAAIFCFYDNTIFAYRFYF